VHAVAPTPKGAWVATARGLVFAHSDRPAGARATDADSLILSTDAVRALVTRGDTLWIGSERGLLILLPGTREPRRVGAAGTDMRLALPVTAVTTADSVVAFATIGDEVVRVHTRTGAVLDAGPFMEAGRVGRINALAMDANTVWVAGDRGVVVIRRDTRAQRALVIGRDLSAEAYGIVLTPQYAWIATRDGGVRVTRTSDGMVR
jgi:ligand-binding sensor domain-containing protein